MTALLALLVFACERPLDHGLCVEVATECSHYELRQEFVSTGFVYEPVLQFEPLRFHFEEIETGYYNDKWAEVYEPHYFVRLKSGGRDEWREVEEQIYYQAAPGQFFDLRQ